LYDFVRDIVLSKSALERGYFNPQSVLNLFNKQDITPNKSTVAALWSLMILELWFREYGMGKL
jgi:hypothetical protein